jgi:molecular chaperone GrpE
VSKARKFALESFADSLLPVMDSLEAGLAVQNATPEQIREGAEATLRQLVSALERNKVIAINQTGVFLCLRAQLQAMLPLKQGGVIINVASVAGLKGLPLAPAYTP